MKKGIILLITLLIPIFSIIPFANNNTPTTINIYYSRYDSVYSTSAFPSFGMLSSNATIYSVTSTIYNNTVSGNNQALHATYNRTIYLFTFGNIKTYSGEIKVTAHTNNTITVYSTIPNLIRVVVESANENELVWAGYSSSNTTTINALAYINGTGKVILEFANGSSISNVTLNVKVNSTATVQESLNLEEITNVKIQATQEGQISIQNQIPRRYAPFMFNVNYNGTSWTNSSGYNVTMAYFNGTFTPALVWKGLGVIGVQGPFGGGGMNISAETIEFYGVNGTVLGYVHIVSVERSMSNSFMGSSQHKADMQFSEVKIVTVKGVKPIHPQFVGKAYVNGQEVIVAGNSTGNVTSTAYVNFTHVVDVHHRTGVLVQISINSTSKFIAVASDNETVNVTTVKPENVSNATVQIQGKAYVSQKVVVNVNASQYILFNVSVLVNNSAVTVYKVVDGQLVQLNSSNYFIVNGKVVVFDDPSTVYYIVYPNETVQTTTTTQTSTTTSSSSQTATSTTTSSQITSSTTSTSQSAVSQSSSTTSSPQTSSINATVTPLLSSETSSTSSSSNTLYIGIAIAVIIIVVGLVVALRRK